METLGLTQQQVSSYLAQQITGQGLIIAANEIFWAAAAIFIALIVLVWFARPPFGSSGSGGGAH